MEQGYTSAILQNAVSQLSTLPGVGRRSALRLALFLLKQPKENIEKFASSFTDLLKIRRCSVCNMISDTDYCPICSDSHRNGSIVCVVESVRDVLSIENTEHYNGLYHVLGGIISPMDGIGPSDLPIDSLLKRIENAGVQEIILALPTSTEGETTAYYLYKKLTNYNIKITSIARGVAFGDDLEYTDEVTLARSIENRQPFKL